MSEVILSRQETQRRFWRRLLADMRALSWPIVTYWGMLLLSLGLFTALLAIGGGLSEHEGLTIVALFWVATVIGVGFGQVCALIRIRTWVVLAVGAAADLALFAIPVSMQVYANKNLVYDTQFEMIIGLVALLSFLFPFFAVSGLLSLRTSVFAVFALFAPLVSITASILYVSEEITGTSGRWFAGDKWAVWDVVTASILLLGVWLSVVYLASRERHRLYRWMTGTGAADAVTIKRIRGSAVGATAMGCGTILTVAMLAVVLTIGTGLLSPYLWRSEERPEGNDTPHAEPSSRPQPSTQPKDPSTGRDDHKAPEKKKRDNNPQPAPSETANGEPDRGDTSGGADPGSEQIVEALRSSGISLFFLILLVVLVLLGLLVFGPPLRRSLLLQSLRSPLSASPSERIDRSWRLCEVALGDLDISREPGDTPAMLVHKAISRLPRGVNLESLAQTAEIVVRARHSLGLDPADEEGARRHAEMAYQSVWEALGEWDRVRAIYRWDL